MIRLIIISLNIIFLLVCSCSKSEPFLIQKSSGEDPNSSSSPSGSKSSSFSNSSYSSWSASSVPYIDYNDGTWITELPTNPLQTVQDLIERSSCTYTNCGKISDSIQNGCWAHCDDISKVFGNLDCGPMHSFIEDNPIDCNSSMFQTSNFAITMNFPSTPINLANQIALTNLRIFVCSPSYPDGNYPRSCKVRNIAINKKPKTFGILIKYPSCSNINNVTNFEYSMVECSNGILGDSTDIIFEKIECSDWMEDGRDCKGFAFGFKQNGTYVTSETNIGSRFEFFDCKHHRTSSYCNLK